MSEEFYENEHETDKTNLIVNYLPQQMTDEEFENLFKKFGNMKSCKIVRNRVNGYSYGFGFVDFESHDQAVKAIEELNGAELDTKKIKVAFARPAGQDIKQANLYIRNVPPTWHDDDVQKIFEPYGKIIQVRVLTNNKGIAFVLFNLRKEAEDALEALNGKTLDGCETPLEIKFAADKKIEKGSSNKVSATNNNNNNNTNNKDNGGQAPHKRERGNRGGRNRDHYKNRMQNRRNRNNQGSNNYYDYQNYDDRQQNQPGNQAQYSNIPYGTGNQYSSNFNMNGVGPMRQSLNSRMNRYAPFIPVQQPMMNNPNPAAPMTGAAMGTLTPNPAYGFPAQQPMIPFAMLPTPQMASMQPVNQAAQLIHNPMAMYNPAQVAVGFSQVSQNTLNNMYSVASNNLTNAANMQPQIGQPMTMRNNMNSVGVNDSHDDGVTLFVYNLGPDDDESELRSMFSPYGNIVKCNVVRKNPGGETKGFGFVTMRDMDQANAAIAGLDRSMKNGRALQVSLKK